MPLLDRFRPLHSSRHADPDVRLAHVESLSIDERQALASAAREDENARVRRAAVAKLMDPAVLAAIARDDADEGVRATAGSMLRDIALEAFEETGEAESLAAVDALASRPDPKIIAQIAKGALRETVASRALACIRDERSLGSVARHARLESIREAAFNRLTQPDEVMAVAMNSEFKDTAIAAVAMLTDRVELEHVAVGAKHKSAAKRARGVLRELDERAALQAAADRSAREAAEAEARTEAASVELRARAEETQQREAERARVAAELVRQQEAESAAQELAERAAAEERGRLEAEHQLVAARETAAREAEARARNEALQKLQRLLSSVEPLGATEQSSPSSTKVLGFAVRDVQAALAALPTLPSPQDRGEIVGRLKAAQTALVLKIQDVRAIQDWQRWANVGVQEALCERMEALKSHEDVREVVARVRALQREWRDVADVPAARRAVLWQRFKTAHDEVWSRCQAHFTAEHETRAANLTKKLALCARVEVLADSTNWLQTAEEIKALQTEWKAIGPSPKADEQAVWERFRAACDRFFTRRHDDLVRRKAIWADNLAKKEALCVRAEALADSNDWDATAAAIKGLQAEWKAIGPVKRNRSEAIWQRFRAACDRFFGRYAVRHEIARGERIAARTAVCEELEALAGSTASDEITDVAPADLVPGVRSLMARWQQETARRGVDPERAGALDGRYTVALSRVLSRWPAAFSGTDLDPEANGRRMEALVKRAEALASSLGEASRSAASNAPAGATLAAMLREALAANTIGVKVDTESRWRAAQEDVRQAQASWLRIGYVPDSTRRLLADRFHRACRQILDRSGRP